ncbi:acyl-CoA dehydrogenase family protein [Pseudoclavibacter endophyticus]|uniref:acyl-CoA dehydrogenase family protein n=1 Tax=Pseudoclavibacter endophyticus TaxID=1778590 RepID=UPI00166B488A|nr:acyl-CoA dehydrogenase family protein [Pseudoclavibacter endophyticus]
MARPTTEDVVRIAENLIPVLRERAVLVDRERRIPDETYRELIDAGLWRILKPTRYGGYEMSEADHAKVAVTLAEGCASTAWVWSILSSDNMAICSFPEQAQEDIWGQNPDATLAGNTTLNLKAAAEKVDGGYRVTGKWGFCSGSDFSEWLIFHAPLGPEREGYMFLVPREEVTTIDDWHPTGLRGTGSRSQAIDRVFVPEHRAQRTSETVDKLAERRTLHPTFDAMYAPYPSYGRFTFSSVGVGAVYGAAKYFLDTASTATRVASAVGGQVRLIDQDYVATEITDIMAQLETAKLVIERRSEEASERARQHRESSEQDLARENRDNAFVARVALRSAQRLSSLVGSKSGFPDHPVSRALRDAELVSHHVTLNWRQAGVRYLASRAAV